MKKLILLVLCLVMAFAFASCEGKQGERGPQGEQGVPGEKGDTGATIKEITFDDQGRMVITLTDGTVLDPIEMPKEEPHVHTLAAEYSCDATVHWRTCKTCDSATVYEEHSVDESGYCTVCDQPIGPHRGRPLQPLCRRHLCRGDWL